MPMSRSARRATALATAVLAAGFRSSAGFLGATFAFAVDGLSAGALADFEAAGLRAAVLLVVLGGIVVL